MSDVPARLHRLVLQRAGARCEYCGLSQEGQEASFHVDHIVPKVAQGPTRADNLALACVSCSLRKEARRSSVDPTSGRKVALFHPRRQRWRDHFRWAGVRILGLTPTGRATVSALRMNRPLILAIREEEAQRNRHPPAS
jgi:HNH endonuclease